MKYVVVILHVVGLTSIQSCNSFVTSRSTRAVIPLQAEEETCVEALHLNKEEINVLNNEDITEEDHVGYNAFLSCYWQTIGWQNVTGELNYELIKSSLTWMIESGLDDESPAVVSKIKQMVVSAVNYCKKHPPDKGSTHGQTAVRMQNCIMRNFNEML